MINTTLCYLENDKQYLMIHRIKKKNDCNHDKWIGIGGKFEEGESPEDCARREVFEETGLKVGKLEYRGIVTFVSKNGNDVYYELMHLFWTNDFTGANGQSAQQLPECEEGELAWVPKEKMKDLPQWESDVIFLELIEKRAPFFSIKVEYLDGKLVKVVQEQ